jgi:hypothetical protein
MFAYLKHAAFQSAQLMVDADSYSKMLTKCGQFFGICRNSGRLSDSDEAAAGSTRHEAYPLL